MTKAKFLENVIEICTGDGSLEILLPYMLEQLELCQKSLAGYRKTRSLYCCLLTYFVTFVNVC